MPDYNAFLQPIGDTSWNPACFRLVKTSGQLTINVSGGGTQYLDFVDQLYFTDLPSNNTSITGVVYYTFMCLDGACAVPLTPYQEAASGFDNEKFAGDYGTDVGSLVSVEPNSTLDQVGRRHLAAGRPRLGRRDAQLFDDPGQQRERADRQPRPRRAAGDPRLDPGRHQVRRGHRHGVVRLLRRLHPLLDRQRPHLDEHAAGHAVAGHRPDVAAPGAAPGRRLGHGRLQRHREQPVQRRSR